MFIGLGSLINAATILIGSAIGIMFGSKLREHTRELIMSVLGLITACAAADMVKTLWEEGFVSALPKGWPIIAILISLILGGLLGSRPYRLLVHVEADFLQAEQALDAGYAASALQLYTGVFLAKTESPFLCAWRDTQTGLAHRAYGGAYHLFERRRDE